MNLILRWFYIIWSNDHNSINATFHRLTTKVNQLFLPVLGRTSKLGPVLAHSTPIFATLSMVLSMVLPKKLRSAVPATKPKLQAPSSPSVSALFILLSLPLLRVLFLLSPKKPVLSYLDSTDNSSVRLPVLSAKCVHLSPTRARVSAT